jgi:hypothetical protein
VTSVKPVALEIRTVPVLEFGEIFGETLNVAIPLVVPEPPDTSEIKDDCEVAVHSHPAPPVIETVNCPPENGRFTVCGVTTKVHTE